VGTTYAKVAADFGITVDAKAIDASFIQDFRRVTRERREAGQPIWETEPGAWGFWRRVLDVIFLRLTNLPCPEDCFQAIYKAFEHKSAWGLFPDVMPALESLRKAGVKMGILSNFDARLHRIVEAMGVKEYFALVLPSTEVGFAKPDKRVFDHALGRLKVEPAQALYVGDDPKTDAAGASQAGMRWLILDRDGRLPASDDLVRSLSEVPERVLRGG
jgi:putative hydrolase of the HAD superfamily